MDPATESHLRELINLHRQETERGFKAVAKAIDTLTTAETKLDEKLSVHIEKGRHPEAIGRGEVYGVLVTILVAAIGAVAMVVM